MLGTAHYISPEQAQGKELSPASDIYSLGVVLYEAATGQLPFDGPDAVSVALKQVNEAPKPPSELNPDIDPALESIIMKAMAKNPRERFATARDMRHALNDYLAGRPVNITGFSGAQTALIAEPIPDIEPTPMAYQTDKTAVMATGTATAGGIQPAAARLRRPDKRAAQKRQAKPWRSSPSASSWPLRPLPRLWHTSCSARMLFRARANRSSRRREQDAHQARSAIEDAGFEVGHGRLRVQRHGRGRQGHRANRRAAARSKPKGTKINLTVSQGIEQVEVPDLTNMNANDARAALQKAGLKYEAGAAEHSDTVKENRVVRQSPRQAKRSTRTLRSRTTCPLASERYRFPMS